MHSDLLYRCGLDPETYPQISSTPCAQDIGGGAQGIAKHYKESKILEEVWREAKSALSREMTESNFRTYLSDTHALAFDRSRGVLILETANPLTTEILARRFCTPWGSDRVWGDGAGPHVGLDGGHR